MRSFAFTYGDCRAARESSRPNEGMCTPVTTPDHAENTGDNLRHAAEMQQQARDDDADTTLPDTGSAPVSPPDFNT